MLAVRIPIEIQTVSLQYLLPTLKVNRFAVRQDAIKIKQNCLVRHYYCAPAVLFPLSN
jgi:hypothetical protein